jgi:predicted LPLAT superfamily acyltransferase
MKNNVREIGGRAKEREGRRVSVLAIRPSARPDGRTVHALVKVVFIEHGRDTRRTSECVSVRLCVQARACPIRQRVRQLTQNVKTENDVQGRKEGGIREHDVDVDENFSFSSRRQEKLFVCNYDKAVT